MSLYHTVHIISEGGAMKKLPVGVQYFDTIRTKDFVYVDKTKQIYDLVSGKHGAYFFLSRPRRFGKSLLISTFKELFKGNASLFEGLWIHTSDYVWEPCSVVHLDFSGFSSGSPEELRTDLSWELDQIGLAYNVDVSAAPSIETKFKFLVSQLGLKSKVVVLIDEYDKPLLEHVNNIEVMHKMQALLKSFFGTTKVVSNYIHFLFMTGITKFSKTSVFSGINNLIDLTVSPMAADLLGYTEHDIDRYFLPHVQEIVRDQQIPADEVKNNMRHWYNGYQFSEDAIKVYNPFSVLMYLLTKRLRNYWFETGTPSFLVNLIREKKYKIEDMERAEINIDNLGSYDIDKMKLVPLLLQTGYLTIKGYDAKTSNYKLGYPNEETKASFLLYFMEMIIEVDAETTKNKTHALTEMLNNGKLQEFFEMLKVFFASIPYDTQLAKEHYYQSIFYVILSLFGVYVGTEVRTNHGRIDCVVITASYIYIFEFKLNGTDAEALAQIERKKYYEKYLHDGKKIVLVGVAFDYQERNIRSWVSRAL